MRQHFHRCGFLRVISLDASDLSGARKAGSQIVEELCAAKKLARCVGLVECDVLLPAQKRELLVARATRLRELDGRASPFAHVSDARAEELETLRDELLFERGERVEENLRRSGEAAGAVRRNPRPVARAEERELAQLGISVFLDDELRELRTARLDAIDRALDAMAAGRYGDCARCGRPIDVARLQAAPDALVCEACAREARPETPGVAR